MFGNALSFTVKHSRPLYYLFIYLFIFTIDFIERLWNLWSRSFKIFFSNISSSKTDSPLKATQLFGHSPSSSPCIEQVEMLVLQLLNKAVRSNVDFFLLFDFSKHFSDLWSQSFNIFLFQTTFLITILPGYHIASDTSEPNFCSFSFSLSFLCLTQANMLTLTIHSNIFPSTMLDMSSNVVVQEMRSYSLYQLWLNNLLPAETYYSLQ